MGLVFRERSGGRLTLQANFENSLDYERLDALVESLSGSVWHPDERHWSIPREESLFKTLRFAFPREDHPPVSQSSSSKTPAPPRPDTPPLKFANLRMLYLESLDVRH